MYTGNMIHAMKALNDQALRVYNNLLSLFNKVDMDIKTNLFLIQWLSRFYFIVLKCGSFIILQTLIKIISVSAGTFQSLNNKLQMLVYIVNWVNIH